MSYEPQKKLTPYFIKNNTEYSSLTTVVDITGSGFINLAEVYATTGNPQYDVTVALKITIDGTIIHNSSATGDNISASINGMSTYGSGVQNNIYSSGNILGRSDTYGAYGNPINIPFASNLKIEVQNSGGVTSSRYLNIIYSKYI